MECGYARLTVWFADPFWVGVYEREAEGRLEVCRHTFGAEPKDGEVWQWLLSAWRGLDFSPAVEAPGVHLAGRIPSGPGGRRGTVQRNRRRHEGPAGPPAPAGGAQGGTGAAASPKGRGGGGAQVPPPPGEKEGEAPGALTPALPISSARINRAPAHILFPR